MRNGIVDDWREKLSELIRVGLPLGQGDDDEFVAWRDPEMGAGDSVPAELTTMGSTSNVAHLDLYSEPKAPFTVDPETRGELILSHGFHGRLFKDSTVFDESADTIWEFTLGRGQVVKGLDDGLLGLCVGEARRLVIPR